MKNTYIIIYQSFLITLLGLQPAFAKDPPTSAEQLRNEFESALKAKDTNALTALFNLQGESDDMKSLMSYQTADLFSHDIAAVKLVALAADFQPTNEVNGVRYKPNVAIVGMIDVEYTEKGNAVSLPYGKKGGAFYISGTVEEKIATPATKEKSLNISVMGSAMPDAGTFTGSYIYVKGGKEIKGNISGKGNLSKAFWGDYIKSCTVQRTSDAGKIKLIITEGTNTIFKSSWVSTNSPIEYVKK